MKGWDETLLTHQGTQPVWPEASSLHSTPSYISNNPIEPAQQTSIRQRNILRFPVSAHLFIEPLWPEETVVDSLTLIHRSYPIPNTRRVSDLGISIASRLVSRVIYPEGNQSSGKGFNLCSYGKSSGLGGCDMNLLTPPRIRGLYSSNVRSLDHD